MRDRLLTAAALAWLAAVVLIAVFGFGLGPADVGSSPDTFTDGRIPRMLASSLIVDDDLPWAQLLLLVVVCALVLVREGPLTWWLAALLGHVGSALLAYGVIGIAIALGSGSAEAATNEWDYGISCIFAAQLGVLALDAWRRLRAGPSRPPGAVAVMLLTAGAFVVFVTDLDWYGLEHLFAFAIGVAVLALRTPRRPAL
jgi:hypothetical protein